MRRDMTDSSDWTFPAAVQPQPEQVRFELSTRLNGVVRVRSEIPENAFTVAALGTERSGNGVAIHAAGHTVILTIGYILAEAQNLWLTTHEGRQLPGHTLAYDPVTGFGLVLPLGPLDIPTIELGSSQSLAVGSPLIIMGHGGLAHAVNSELIARREFAGYWEYLLDEALFVAPPHPEWGGAALIDAQGALVGLGSLLVQEYVRGDHFDANLFIPIDLLKPILNELVTTGAVARPTRPWLGLYTTEQDGQVIIAGVTQAGPAAEAQLRNGDVIMQVGAVAVHSLPQFYRSLWSQGPAGCTITLHIRRGQHRRDVQLRSASRDHYLRRPVAH